jgi:uncharacterized protein GlcG (DUF336 family)
MAKQLTLEAAERVIGACKQKAAVGVSGGSPEEDHDVAAAGAAAL